MWVILGLIGSFFVLMLLLTIIAALTYPQVWVALLALSVVLNIRRMMWPERQGSSR